MDLQQLWGTKLMLQVMVVIHCSPEMCNAAELPMARALFWQFFVLSATAGIKRAHVGEI